MDKLQLLNSEYDGLCRARRIVLDVLGSYIIRPDYRIQNDDLWREYDKLHDKMLRIASYLRNRSYRVHDEIIMETHSIAQEWWNLY